MNIEEMDVYKKSHDLVLNIYAITKKFPREEFYCLVPQIRRAAYSIPMNLVEGCGRESDKELNQFIKVCLGSVAELKYQIRLSKDLNYISQSKFEELNKKVNNVLRMLYGLRKFILNKQNN